MKLSVTRTHVRAKKFKVQLMLESCASGGNENEYC